MRRARPAASSVEWMFCWNTTNSSPPKRATKSSGRSISRSRAGHRAQQLVAARMAERVVDLLELVEVDEQQRRQLFGALLDRQQAADLVAEIDPVGKLGQFVVARQMADPGFRVLALGDVLDQHDGAAAGHRLERPGQRAVLAEVRIGRDDVAGAGVSRSPAGSAGRSPPTSFRRRRRPRRFPRRWRRAARSSSDRSIILLKR